MHALSRLSVASLLVSAIIVATGCAKDSESVVAPVGQAPAAVESMIEPTPVAVDAATKYDNKIVHQPDAGRGKDDGWFLVKDGKRRWITESSWPEANGYKADEVIYITSDEFNAIPEDPRPLPETPLDAAQQPAEAVGTPEVK